MESPPNNNTSEFQKRATQLEELEGWFEQSAKASRAARELFGELIPQSLNKPQNTPPVLTSVIGTYKIEMVPKIEKLRWLEEKGFDDAFDRLRGEIMDWTEESDSGVEERIIRDEGEKISVQERIIKRAKDGNPHLVVSEKIKNYVFGENERRANYAKSSIAVTDKTSGITIDLGELLPDPEKIEFIPSKLNREEKWFDKKEKQVRRKPIFTDLREYKGVKEKDDSFALKYYIEERDRGTIQYSDIRARGGLLSILHEIAHAWQNFYELPLGRISYEKLIKLVQIDLAVLQDLRNEVLSEKISMEHYTEKALPYITKELEEAGVSIDKEKYTLSESEEVPEGKIEIRGMRGERFVIESEKLERLASDYAREERDAWAHAIRILRFLRKQGIDLEPGLESSNELRRTVHESLNTYQKTLEEEIAGSLDRIKAFTIHTEDTE